MNLGKKAISYSTIWKIAYPIILGSIAQNLINVTDTAFLGHLSEEALGTSAVAGVLYIAIFMLGMGFSQGMQIAIARKIGEEKPNDSSLIFYHGIFFLFILSLIIITVVLVFQSKIWPLLISNKTLIPLCTSYMKYRILGLVFAFFNVCFRSFFIGIATTRFISINTFILAIVNIVLDYLLIFGKFGFPTMGIEGAALASVIAELSAFISFYIYTFYKKQHDKYGIKKRVFIKFKTLIKLLKIAYPMMFSNFLSLSIWFVFFLFVEQMGIRPLAISNIMRSIYLVLMIPIWGFATSANTIVSNLIGQDRLSDIFPAIQKIIIACCISIVPLITINYIMPETVLSIYTDDISLIQASKNTLYVISGVLFFFGTAMILFQSVSGTGATLQALIIEITTLTIYLSAVFYIALQIKAPIEWVWSSEYIYGITMAVLSFWYLKSNRWIGKKVL